MFNNNQDYSTMAMVASSNVNTKMLEIKRKIAVQNDIKIINELNDELTYYSNLKLKIRNLDPLAIDEGIKL